MFAKLQRIHFVGIGGIGMSGIAEVLLNLGYKVSGSDLKSTAATERLVTLGATVSHGHRAENIPGADVVVVSSAVPQENVELVEAGKLDIPVIQRAEMLSELMRQKYGIAIAGMHGKTTTTSMVAAVLSAGGLDPTVVVGGRVGAMNSNARLGKSNYLVAEADESDRSFLKLSPILAVVTNIDREHMDCYRSMADIKRAFLDFMNLVPFYGMVVACNDNPLLRKLIMQVRRRTVTYGVRRGSDFRIKIVRKITAPAGTRPISRFTVDYRGQDLGEFSLHVPGLHNILNATAAIAVGVGLDIHVDQIRTALENFRGVDRRFQLLGTCSGISVIDDYGHHPTEIRATLAAAKDSGYRKIHVIFQPHRYTRTQLLMDDFATAFELADSLIVLDIYAASEKPIEGITGEALADRISKSKLPVQYATLGDAVGLVTELAQEGDMILTLGAGSVSHLGPEILQSLQSRRQTVAAAQPVAATR
ncbi:MAG: UDP-N-acetylmuramate--L-alanine ligase [Terriglobales bacterium]